jgi:hypothetical protein
MMGSNVENAKVSEAAWQRVFTLPVILKIIEMAKADDKFPPLTLVARQTAMPPNEGNCRVCVFRIEHGHDHPTRSPVCVTPELSVQPEGSRLGDLPILFLVSSDDDHIALRGKIEKKGLDKWSLVRKPGNIEFALVDRTPDEPEQL